MWPQYLQNQFFKTRLGLLFIGFTLLRSEAFSQNEPLGLIETLKSLSEIHKERYRDLKTEIRKNPKVLSSLEGVTDIRINHHFMQNIIFRTDFKYLPLIKQGTCTFYPGTRA